MDGSSLHPVLHGGVSLRLDAVVNEVFDFSYVSFSQFYLIHCFSPAPLPGRLGPAFGKKLALFLRCHGRDNLFTCLKIIKVLNSLDSVFALRASSVPDFHVRLLGAIAIGGRLGAALRAEHN